jgi:peptide/nickel transport system ATP-binding protein/oligopeptide transport system ATP-binding protein
MLSTQRTGCAEVKYDPMSQPILSIENLKTWFYTDQGIARAVDGVSFDIHEGQTLAVVGESGCGKSVTAMSILGLVPSPPGRIVEGSILFEGRDLTQCTAKDLQAIRGNDISMIFQEPMTSMNPTFRVGRQIAATIQLHRKVSRAEAHAETIRLLGQVGIPAPESRVDDFPHQMSGGMLQRAMIAMALACDPKVLIADEPTTALDVTVQAQILALLKRLQEERGMAVLLITHDLGVVAETADEVVVMYAGKNVEQAPVSELFDHPAHPYTRELFASLPAMNTGRDRLSTIKGIVPAATSFPPGCRFHPRCPDVMDRCRIEEPPAFETGANHCAACWLHAGAPVAAAEN